MWILNQWTTREVPEIEFELRSSEPPGTLLSYTVLCLHRGRLQKIHSIQKLWLTSTTCLLQHWRDEEEEVRARPSEFKANWNCFIYNVSDTNRVEVFLSHQQPILKSFGHRLSVQQLNSILTLTTWDYHQTSQIKGSVPRDCPASDAKSKSKLMVKC